MLPKTVRGASSFPTKPGIPARMERHDRDVLYADEQFHRGYGHAVVFVSSHDGTHPDQFFADVIRAHPGSVTLMVFASLGTASHGRIVTVQRASRSIAVTLVSDDITVEKLYWMVQSSMGHVFGIYDHVVEADFFRPIWTKIPGLDGTLHVQTKTMPLQSECTPS